MCMSKIRRIRRICNNGILAHSLVSVGRKAIISWSGGEYPFGDNVLYDGVLLDCLFELSIDHLKPASPKIRRIISTANKCLIAASYRHTHYPRERSGGVEVVLE